MKRTTLFDEENKLEILSKIGDPLERIAKAVDFEVFRKTLVGSFEKKDPSQGGRRPIDKVLLFKILILQEYYSLSDDKIEFHINDRLTFMRFLGLGLGEKSPDAKTIWAFRDHLTTKGLLEKLFAEFTKQLDKLGLIAHKGSIIDATIVKAPIQRNSKEENDQINNGQVPSNWSENKTRQKDVDATWTRKRFVNYYGYKNHTKVDTKSKIITDFVVTTASLHDSQVLDELISHKDQGKSLHGDSAYSSKECLEILSKKGIIPKINKKGYKNKKLTPADIRRNHKLSKIRCRVEHVYGQMKQVAGSISIRCRSLKRAATSIILKNLSYNISRAAFLLR